MSKLIYFHKSLRYDPTLGGLYSLYAGYVKSTQSVIDPPLKTQESALGTEQLKICFSSSTLRTQQTALLEFKSAKHYRLADLDEVSFDLSKLVSEHEFKIHGSKIVRKRFIDNFVNDTLTEKRTQIFRRIDKLFKELVKIDDDVACISHSFFMKILEADIKSGHKIRTKPDLLRNYLLVDKHTYPYGTGFRLTENNGVYSPIKNKLHKEI